MKVQHSEHDIEMQRHYFEEKRFFSASGRRNVRPSPTSGLNVERKNCF
jgi:hypothetical protein